MGFTEITFLFVFLPASIVLYLLADKVFHNDTVDNVMIVIFSFVFYYWAGKETIIVFVALALFTYMAGRILCIDKKKSMVVFSLFCLVGTLVFYKYAQLVGEWINEVTKKPYTDYSKLLAPIGVSFVVFESISYVIDIYRDDAKAGSLLDCLTFLSLFSKLVSGPIVLWKDFQPQLKNRRVKLDEIAAGIDRIIIGLAKKAVIADSLGERIAAINTSTAAVGTDTMTLWLRALLYFFQLYFDFSGYSDIAIGVSRIFGFRCKENFHYPYLSQSITEFWRRWHISLGTWFREYVYIPLGGNRRGIVYVNLLVVFLLTGLWHGAGWQFIVWGGIHGLFIVFERAIRDKKWYKKCPGIFKWLITTSIVFFAWIFFMSNDVKTGWQTIVKMFESTNAELNFTWRYYLSNRTVLFLGVIVFGHVFGIKRIEGCLSKFMASNSGMVLRRLLLLMLFVVDILYVVSSSYSPFLYFQF